MLFTSILGDAYHEILPRKYQRWQHGDVQFPGLCGQSPLLTMGVSHYTQRYIGHVAPSVYLLFITWLIDGRLRWYGRTQMPLHAASCLCCFSFMLLLVLRMIFRCVSRVIFLVATLAASQWTNWCLHWCCVPSSDAMYEAHVVSLDSEPLSPVWGVCVAMNCWCGKGEEDDIHKKWEVLRNI